jgi:hypothetical protein
VRVVVVTIGVAVSVALAAVACATGSTDDSSTGDQGTGDGSANGSEGGAQGGGNVGASDGGAGSQATDDGASVDNTVDAADAGPTCVESDASCTSGSPGACGDGVMMCEGGAPICVPRVTTQSCYSDDGGTQDKGICHGGTQTCVGTLGTCVGEVLPLGIEGCFNTTDDDCNGVVNNGCPKSISLGADRALNAAGGSGGNPTSVHCPAGAFVTRVDSWFDDSDKKASGVSIFCATPTLVQGATSYSVTLTPNTPAPYVTQTGSNSPKNERQDDCGIVGLTAITSMSGLQDSYVEALGNHCGTSQVTLAANNTITFNFVPSGSTDYNAYGATPPGTFFDFACNANEVIVGFDMRDGSWLDQIQPICAPLVVNYVP